MAEPTVEVVESEEFQLDLRQYVDTVLRRRWAVAAFFVVSVTVVTLFTLRQPKIYQATATIVVESQAPQVLGQQVQDVVDVGSGAAWMSKEYYETQFNIMRSRSLAEKVSATLGLDHDDAFLGLDAIQDPALREQYRKSADPAGMVQGGVSAETMRESRVVSVHFTDRDPARAARICNAIVDAYVQQNVDRKVEVSRSAATWLQDQLKGLQDQLRASELTLYTYKRDNDLVDSTFENKQTLSQQKLASIEGALSNVQQHRAELEAKEQAIQAAQKSSDPLAMESLPEVAKSAEVIALRGKLLEAQVEEQQLEVKYGPDFPKLIEAKDRVASLKEALSKEQKRVVNASLNDYKIVTATESNLIKLLEGAKRESFDVNKKEMDYKRLAREEENNQRLYELVLKRLKEIDLSGINTANNVYKLDAALVPGAPIKPRIPSNIALGALLGLLGGLALAFFLEYQDSTIATQEEVERVLGVSMLGLLPTIKAGPNADSTTRDLFVQQSPKSSVAECSRIIRTNLNFLGTERPLKRILVTSAGPQEGKTTSLVSVGITMAQSGQKTLLIDTDLRRPRLHRSFKLSNERGLTTLIAEGGKAVSLVQQSEVPNLYVLTAGPIPPNPAELLHTDRFQEILKELEGEFDRVMLDSPPVGAVSDALVLSGYVDGVVLVLKAFQSDRSLCRQTLRALRDVRAKVLGAVLNNVDLDKKQYGYYQGYYYGYGKYYGDGHGPGRPNRA
ncbi:MAG: polysaccharide biosynthesis tyrosine autokinase [Deltaproteobacteria bacterium]|nr:polysaccharide biosynthesis tyrosine autokinase [Deltaproteobacteria bacterium]